MAFSHYYACSSKPLSSPAGKTEFDILKESHRFLRELGDAHENDDSWNEQLAAKYYSTLYREFAICDLKHYKSGNFALRWRSEDEVLSGAGESTCGNNRCDFHNLPEHLQSSGPSLTTLELPFAYQEHGENKSALVKVVLCPKCLKKLVWKRRKEKEAQQAEERRAEGGTNMNSAQEDIGVEGLPVRSDRGRTKEDTERSDNNKSRGKGHRPERHSRDVQHAREQRRRSSRSRSPRDRQGRRRDSRKPASDGG